MKHRNTGSLTTADRPPTAGQRHIQCFERLEYYVRVRIRFYIRLKIVGWLLLPLLVGCAGLMAPVSRAQLTLNVTNFGAVGDAVQFFVNTTSNSVVVTTTNQLFSADIGKAIEIFGAGPPTSGVDSYGNNTNGNQDIVATITDVQNGTNIYVSQLAQATLTNTFATYGHSNQTNFQNAIAAASGTNTIVNVPAGKYLFLSTYASNLWASVEIVLTNGGIRFAGAGPNDTILLGQGAWTLQAGSCRRGFLFSEVPPINNDYPVSIENMTLDGGVQQGNTSIHGQYPNPVDGLGWDGSHGAFDIRGFTGRVFTHMTWTNLVFTHWRGEIVKSNDGNTNGNITMEGCVFRDGNATAINIYPALLITNCVFDNLWQVGEYYQMFSTNTSYFVNNLVTNISGNGLAINGGRGNNPPFVIQGNTFDFNTNSEGYNAIETTPGDNIYVVSNQIAFESGRGICVAAGVPGYQGTWDNSNIVVHGNTFIKASAILEVNGGGMAYSDTNKTEAVEVYGNTLISSNAPNYTSALVCYTYATNIWFHDNDFRTGVQLGYVNFSSGSRNAPLALVDTNNNYYSMLYDAVGVTNYVSYANGSRFEVIYAFHPGTVYALTDTNASQMPVGAQILIQNDNSSSNSIPVYLNSALTSGPINVDYGQSLTANWSHGIWATNVPSMVTGFHIVQ